MRAIIYDRAPGPGFQQAFLALCWRLGCVLQKLAGRCDAYLGARSWTEAINWLAKQPAPLTSIQYWGHGSPGAVWLAGAKLDVHDFGTLVCHVAPSSVVWFRTCSTFQGVHGFSFSQQLADGLGCTIAGHTRIIGPLQGGLHTRKPHTAPSWPVTEGDLPGWLATQGLAWGSNTVTCLATAVPEDL